TGRGASEGLESGGIWDEVKYRIRAYPVALCQILWALIRALYPFAKTVWAAEIFPLRPPTKIADHGKVVGYLEGDKAQSAGRRLALPFILLFAGIKLWDLAGFIFVAIITAQILVWVGAIEKPGEGFTAIFWVALGCLSLSMMIESYHVFYKHRTV